MGHSPEARRGRDRERGCLSNEGIEHLTATLAHEVDSYRQYKPLPTNTKKITANTKQSSCSMCTVHRKAAQRWDVHTSSGLITVTHSQTNHSEWHQMEKWNKHDTLQHEKHYSKEQIDLLKFSPNKSHENTTHELLVDFCHTATRRRTCPPPTKTGKKLNCPMGMIKDHTRVSSSSVYLIGSNWPRCILQLQRQTRLCLADAVHLWQRAEKRTQTLTENSHRKKEMNSPKLTSTNEHSKQWVTKLS